MQRQLSSFDIYVITLDLQETIDCHIDKIYQLSRNEILIRIRNSKTKQKESIYIRNGKIICLTKKEFQTPQKPSTFAMTLRKYLQNGRILGISQHEFDRILKIKIGKKEGEYTIVIEFFSDGNIILTDPEEKIIIPLIRQSWAHRKVKGRETYIPPPSQNNPFNLSLEQFTEIIKQSNADIVRTLAVGVNLSGPIAEELCTLSKIEKNKKIEELEPEDISNIYKTLQKLLKKFKNKKYKPVLVKKDKKVVDILPFEFKSYKNIDFLKTDSLIRGLEELIEIEQKIETKKVESKTEKQQGKLNRQLKQQQGAVEKLKIEVQVKKKNGDLIFLNYQPCEKLLNNISQVLELKDKTEEIKNINDLDFVKIFDPECRAIL